MKAIFFHSNNLPQVAVGVGSIFAVLEQQGYKDIKYVDLNTPNLLDKLLGNDLILVSSTEPYLDEAKKYIQSVKNKEPNTKILVGGVPASIASLWLMKKHRWVDAICVGEGEESITPFLNNPDRTDIKNIWYRDGDDITKNPVRPLGYIDDLPFIRRDIFPDDYNQQDRAIMMSGRGCPYSSCNYCSDPAMRILYKECGSKYLRRRNLDSVIKEMKIVSDTYNPTKGFLFADESFVSKGQRIFEFCDKYEASGIGKNIQCMARPESLTEDIVKRISEVGFDNISIGVECTDEERRKKYLNRNYSNDLLLEVFDRCRRYGITTNSFNMLGIPGDTPQYAKEMLEFNLKLKPDIFQVTVLYPFHGTEFREMYEKNGWIKESDVSHPISSEYWSPTVSLPDFPAAQLLIVKNQIQAAFRHKIKFYRNVEKSGFEGWMSKLTSR